VAAYACDREGLIVYFNAQAERFWGRTPKLNDPEDRFCGSFRLWSAKGAPMRHDRCWMARTLAEERSYLAREIIVERQDGRRLQALAYANPVRDASGELCGAVNILVDIGDRRRAESALNALSEVKIDEERSRRSRNQLAEAQEIAHVGSWERDTLTNRVTWSDELYRIFGVDRNSFTPTHQSILERVHPEDRERVAAMFRPEWASDLQPYSLEYRLLRPGGEVRFVQARGRAMPHENGRIARWAGTLQDVTERVQAFEALRKAQQESQESREQLRRLVARKVTVREEERRRVSREIHDELGQVLTALKLDASLIAEALPRSDRRTRARVRRVSARLDGAISIVRRIAQELRPPILDQAGLAAAIEWQLEEFSRASGLRCALVSDELPALNPATTTALFRILQEALTNVARHARARRVDVSLLRRDGSVVLQVVDDGRGFRIAQTRRRASLGIVNMTERALLVGGTLVVRGSPGRGTTVTATVPLR